MFRQRQRYMAQSGEILVKAVLTSLLVMAMACPALPQAASAEDGFALPGSGSARGKSDANGVITFFFDQDTDHGFMKEDWLIRGKIEGNTFAGQIHVHFLPVENWRRVCPEQWETSLPFTANLLEDGRKWVGSYKSPGITPNCTYQGEREFSYELDVSLLDVQQFGLLDKTHETATFRPTLPPPVSTEKPSGLWIVLSAFSAPAGRNIPVAVVVAGKTAPTVIADRDIPVQLKAGEQVSQVTIPKGQSYEVANVILSSTPGSVPLEASAPGLGSAKETVTVCADARLDDFVFGYSRQQAPADGETPIPVKITFQNIETGQPTSGNQRKVVQILSNGVGIWTKDGHELVSGGIENVAEDQCEIRRQIVSNKAGIATVTASFRNESKISTFTFVPYIDRLVLSWITVGALAGASIRIWQRRRKGRTWRAVMMEFFIGCMAGVIVFLAFYLGIGVWPSATLPVSFSVDFFIGFMGGFLGSSSIKLVAKVFTDRFKPGDRSNGQGKTRGEAAGNSAAPGSV